MFVRANDVNIDVRAAEDTPLDVDGANQDENEDRDMLSFFDYLIQV